MIFRSPFPDPDIPDVSLWDFIESSLREGGDAQAIVDGLTRRALTYAQIRAGSLAFACGLYRRGFRRGDVLAAYLPNVPEYALVFLGVARQGGIITTLNPMNTAEEVERQLRETGARLLVTVGPLADKALEAAARIGGVEVFALGEHPGTTPFQQLLVAAADAPPGEVDPANDVVALPYSSGTSGLPKGVMLTHRNLVAQLCQASMVSPLVGGGVSVAVLPYFHIYGMAVILLAALRNRILQVCLARFDLDTYLQCLQDYRVEHASVVPPIAIALAKHPAVAKYDLSALRHISSGAAPLGAEVEQACQARLGCELAQGWGMTEVSGAAITSIMRGDRIMTRSGSVGVCWPGVEARIVDLESGRDLGTGERGELLVRGPTIMRGYFRNPDATAAVLDAEGWLRTGDIACVDADGFFFIVDRVKELIKCNAYQIAPAELEAVVVSHPAVADAAVVPSPEEEHGEVPKAYVVRKGELSAEELMDYVAARVAPYKKLRRVEFVESIPRSPSGKILRRVLVERERTATSG